LVYIVPPSPAPVVGAAAATGTIIVDVKPPPVGVGVVVAGLVIISGRVGHHRSPGRWLWHIPCSCSEGAGGGFARG
jgi:hypothetical protein